ncbi:unnamed protein product, partial [Ectocarpus fasciculatus]
GIALARSTTRILHARPTLPDSRPVIRIPLPHAICQAARCPPRLMTCPGARRTLTLRLCKSGVLQPVVRRFNGTQQSRLQRRVPPPPSLRNTACQRVLSRCC